MLIKMPANTKHQVEDIIIRFKTIRPVGLLFATTHKSGDRVEIGVFGGKIRLMIQINNREKVIYFYNIFYVKNFSFRFFFFFVTYFINIYAGDSKWRSAK